MKKVYDDANEYFEEMKKETEEKRVEREAAWADRELSEREKEERAEQRSGYRFLHRDWQTDLKKLFSVPKPGLEKYNLRYFSLKIFLSTHLHVFFILKQV